MAWFAASLSSGTATILHQHNIANVEYRGNLTWLIHFSKNFPNGYYATACSFEADGNGQEISGIYQQTVNQCAIDIQNPSRSLSESDVTYMTFIAVY